MGIIENKKIDKEKFIPYIRENGSNAFLEECIDKGYIPFKEELKAAFLVSPPSSDIFERFMDNFPSIDLDLDDLLFISKAGPYHKTIIKYAEKQKSHAIYTSLIYFGDTAFYLGEKAWSALLRNEYGSTNFSRSFFSDFATAFDNADTDLRIRFARFMIDNIKNGNSGLEIWPIGPLELRDSEFEQISEELTEDIIPAFSNFFPATSMKSIAILSKKTKGAIKIGARVISKTSDIADVAFLITSPQPYIHQSGNLSTIEKDFDEFEKKASDYTLSDKTYIVRLIKVLDALSVAGAQKGIIKELTDRLSRIISKHFDYDSLSSVLYKDYDLKLLFKLMQMSNLSEHSEAIHRIMFVNYLMLNKLKEAESIFRNNRKALSGFFLGESKKITITGDLSGLESDFILYLAFLGVKFVDVKGVKIDSNTILHGPIQQQESLIKLADPKDLAEKIEMMFDLPLDMRTITSSLCLKMVENYGPEIFSDNFYEKISKYKNNTHYKIIYYARYKKILGEEPSDEPGKKKIGLKDIIDDNNIWVLETLDLPWHSKEFYDIIKAKKISALSSAENMRIKILSSLALRKNVKKFDKLTKPSSFAAKRDASTVLPKVFNNVYEIGGEKWLNEFSEEYLSSGGYFSVLYLIQQFGSPAKKVEWTSRALRNFQEQKSVNFDNIKQLLKYITSNYLEEAIKFIDSNRDHILASGILKVTDAELGNAPRRILVRAIIESLVPESDSKKILDISQIPSFVLEKVGHDELLEIINPNGQNEDILSQLKLGKGLSKSQKAELLMAIHKFNYYSLMDFVSYTQKYADFISDTFGEEFSLFRNGMSPDLMRTLFLSRSDINEKTGISRLISQKSQHYFSLFDELIYVTKIKSQRKFHELLKSTVASGGGFAGIIRDFHVMFYSILNHQRNNPNIPDSIKRKIEIIPSLGSVYEMHDLAKDILDNINTLGHKTIEFNFAKQISPKIEEASGDGFYYKLALSSWDFKEAGRKHGWCVGHVKSYTDRALSGDVFVFISRKPINSIDDVEILAHFSAIQRKFSLIEARWSKVVMGRSNVDATGSFKSEKIIEILNELVE